MRLRLHLLAAALLLTGVTVVTVASVGLARDRPAPSAFGHPASPPHDPATKASTDGAPGLTQPTAAATPPAVPAAVSASVPGTAAPPTRLLIPRLRVTAPVETVDTVDGMLQVPADVAHVGWWRASVPAGSATGTTVIDGHVDSAQDGLGALFDLTRLQPGDAITLTTAAAQFTYRVYARGVYVKAAGLPPALFTSAGPGRLVVISCGGPFDRAARSYEDNIAVFAALQT